MLLIFLSTARSCASTAASPVVDVFGPVTFTLPVAGGVVEPVAVPDVDEPPLELAVPSEFVPGDGGGASFAALPCPLGSLTTLPVPPGLAGPAGTPLVAALPAPAEPAAGEPTALCEKAADDDSNSAENAKADNFESCVI